MPDPRSDPQPFPTAPAPEVAQVLELVTDPFYVVDGQWRIVYVNPPALTAFGCTMDEVRGHVLWDAYPSARDPQLRDRLQQVARERRGLSFEARSPSLGRWFEVRCHPCMDGVAVYLKDIHDRKLVEEALAARSQALLDADRRKDEFLATLSHELRSPLAPIRQAVQVAAAPGASAEQVRWSHAVIERQVRHMARLLDDLLDITRISHGALTLHLAPVVLQAVVAGAVETARPLLDGRRHALQLQVDCPSLQLVADGGRLTQLLGNLLVNAAKYTAPGGRIALQAGVEDDTLVVRVRDDGIGIAAEHLDSVFGMFMQVQPAIDRSEGGLGVGLALSRSIAALHGGTLSAHSAGLGRGSEFVLRIPLPAAAPDALPVAAGAARAADAAHAPRRARAALKVLVADDNVDAAESLALLLSLEGLDVRTAHDGAEALAQGLAFRPDVALLDIGMPRLNGYEVAAAWRAQAAPGARPLLVAVSGWGSERDKQRSREAGFDLHLTKPVDAATLSRLLAQAAHDAAG